MTDFSPLLLADRGQPAIILHIVDSAGFDTWVATQPERTRTLLAAARFKGTADSLAILPGDAAGDWSAVVGVKSVETLGPWCLARAAESLAEGTYRLATGSPGATALGWLLAQHRFDRYRADDKPVGPRILLTDAPAGIADTIAEAHAIARVRDMVNTPAADMGPADIEAIAADIAKVHGAALTVTRGAELESGYPMVHAVGMAASRGREPRLVELIWGDPAHPRIAIVGKGVCFDTGGLDLKPSSGMRLMKKDMGGAAHALALAQLIMNARLPVRLHLLVPAVENSVAGNAFRPGDVLTSRQGLTVEIANTDAEGRLVLGDALTRAGEENPELIVDFATLTGAARVALGPDLPATFANDDALANDAIAAGLATDDPLWRMPLYAGYDDMLKSDIADLNNAPEGGFAGSVTAALFLQRFVPAETPWMHLDTFAWRPAGKPGRPKGGEALGLRAVWSMLQGRYRR
ncbi:MAG: leucyl aminopeptidase family protein [Sphingomonadales bacterium]